MNKKIKRFLTLNAIILSILSITLMLIGLFHDCHGEGCLICSFASIGLVLVNLLLVAFLCPIITYKIKELIKIYPPKMYRINLKKIDYEPVRINEHFNGSSLHLLYCVELQ